MKTYIESIFIINYLLDYMILYGTKRILNKNTKNYKLLLSSLLGSLTTFIVYIKISTIELLLVKLIISIGMIYISFGKKDFLKTILYFYCISVILGGSFYLFEINKLSYKRVLILIITPFLLKTIIKEYKKYKNIQKEKYMVELTISDKKYNLVGFLDSGNQLKSPISEKSVILVDLYIPHKKSYYIPYKALNTEGIIECMKAEKIVINEKEIKSCLIGFSKDPIHIDGCNCILPNSLKEELC